MLHNQNIICISSIDWDFVWQGHQEIMAAFAKNGNRVLFIENTGIRKPNFHDFPRLRKRMMSWFKSIKGFREEFEGLHVYSPMFLPFPYSRISRFINRHVFLGALKRWVKVMDFHNPIIWTFLPTGTALDIICNIEHKLLVYYCIADFYELADDSGEVKRTEDELAKMCDLIFAQGDILARKFRAINGNVHIFPFGVNIEVFRDFKTDSSNIPLDVSGIKRPIIGYVGGIHRHIDFELLKFAAESRPDWSFVFVGPLQFRNTFLDKLKNVFFLGAKDFSELPIYIDKFDVCLVPYLKSEYTDTVFPTKLNEYHALGKPVVSTGLPEVVRYNEENGNIVFIGDTKDEFLRCICSALAVSGPDLVMKRKACAENNNWKTRINEMSEIMEAVIEKNEKLAFNWRERFLGIYHKVHRTMLLFLLPSVFFYFALFYTQFIWFVAEPLKILDKPKKSDAIVVLGGGVGESGRAEQGYEERVSYAVQLYKEGYARHLLFSSGYMYIFKEPIKMKILALSLGVPEEAIILDDKAANTFENVAFSFNILKDHDWHDVLLVSSPYHMRRVFLVVKKNFRGARVAYLPIPRSIFYSHPAKEVYNKTWFKFEKQANFRQVKGILQEYAAIFYYWLKGKI